MGQVKSIRLGEGECITSYDVKALFTSVPVNPAISKTRHKLKQDKNLYKRPCQYNTSHHCWSYTLRTLISSSKVGVINSHMGQPCNPPSVPLWSTSVWKSLKPRPTTLPPHPPKLWLKDVDDTFITQKAEHYI